MSGTNHPTPDNQVERMPLELPIVHGYIMPLPTSDRCIHGVQLGAHCAGNYEACDICFYLVQRHREVLDAGRVNAPSGTTSEPVATEPQGSAGESPAPIPFTSNVVVSIQDGMFLSTDGAGSFTRPATDDEKLFWAEVIRLRSEHEADLERMERAAAAIERLTLERDEAQKLAQFECKARHDYYAYSDRLRAALLELVSCKALREKIDGELSACHQEMSPQLQAMENEYQLRKPLAWRDARAALSGEHPPSETTRWQPIETAPKDGRTLLLGYYNACGKWRTLRGEWFNRVAIDEWKNGEDCSEGWYETSVENDDIPNCWPTEPTHWSPLPQPPLNGNGD